MIIALSLWRDLHNSMKLWAMPCRATQNGKVIVKKCDKIWSIGGGMGNYSNILAERTPWTVWKDKKYRTLENEHPRKEDIQIATGEERRAFTNSSRKNEVSGTKQKGRWIVDVYNSESKVWCYKEEEYHIGTLKVGSMNQGTLDVIKGELTRLNINILGNSELKWME